MSSLKIMRAPPDKTRRRPASAIIPIPGESQAGGRHSSEDGWHDGMDDGPLREMPDIDLTGSDEDTSLRAGGGRTDARQKSRVDRDSASLEEAVDRESCFANVGVEGGGTGSSRNFRGVMHARKSTMERASSTEKLGRRDTDNRGGRRHRQNRPRMHDSGDPLDGPLAQQKGGQRGRGRDRDTSITAKIGSNMDRLAPPPEMGNNRSNRQDHKSNKAGKAAEARRQKHGMNQSRKKRNSSPHSDRDSSSSSRKKHRSRGPARRDEAINAEGGSEDIQSALHQARQRVDNPDTMNALLSTSEPDRSSSRKRGGRNFGRYRRDTADDIVDSDDERKPNNPTGRGVGRASRHLAAGSPQRPREINPTKQRSERQGMIFDDKRGRNHDRGGKGDWTTTTKIPKKSSYGKKPGSGSKQSKLQYPTQQRKNPRRSSRNKSANNSEVIEIDDSSDEEEFSNALLPKSSPSKSAFADKSRIEAVRIAIGKRVMSNKCGISFQLGTKQPYIQFSYEARGKIIDHTVLLKRDDLEEVKFFVPKEDDEDDSDDQISFIAFRIKPNEQNDFKKFSNTYDQSKSPSKKGSTDIMKRYIAVEVRDPDTLHAMLLTLRDHDIMKVWCGEGSEAQKNEIETYASTLIEESKKDRDSRRRQTRSGRKKGKDSGAENKLLLVYPFKVDETVLAEASRDLLELSGDKLGVPDAEDPTPETSQPVQNPSTEVKKKGSSRVHYVTIREEERDRLAPGQFLNDSLVDFWMRWISRGENPQDSSVHFFTSHFMTTLRDDGPEAVASWTANKGIDIFKKKFVFVPINKDLHWSLCVIVNPGEIASVYDEDVSSECEHPCLLFLDSLKMHNKNQIRKTLLKWLNAEWKAKKKGEEDDSGLLPHDPFQNNSMNLIVPKVPYQENGCDCGVFVCRYAYALYVMRFTVFSWDHIENRLKILITKGPAFRFDMEDIARIRIEIGTLIKRLEKEYRAVKGEEKREKNRSKMAAKSEEPSLNAEVAATGGEPATKESKRTSQPGEAVDDLQNTDSENESDTPLPKATNGNIETPEIDTLDTLDPMDTSDGERDLKDSQNTEERAAAALAAADKTLDAPDHDEMMADVHNKPDGGETDEGDSEVLLDSDVEDLSVETSAPAAKPSSPGSDTEATGHSENSMCLDTSPAASSAKETEALDEQLSQTQTSQSSQVPKAVAPTEKENHPNLETSHSDDGIENQSTYFSAQRVESADCVDV